VPALGPVRFLTIHCAATPEGRHVSHQQITEWDKAKFGQTSYHWVVEIDGSMHRTLRDDQKGAHVGGANTGNIGICYVGGVEKNGKTPKDTRTDLQKKTLLTLVRTYKERYPGIIIRGHRDWSPDLDRDGKIEPHEWIKNCPCFDVTDWLKETGDA
jgi:N-acetyl-anhydromuramyl-L-alanine amidase AmpD